MNEQTLRLWWSVFGGRLVEVRGLEKRGPYSTTHSGYFKDVDSLLRALPPVAANDAVTLYFTLNDPAEACYSRIQCERIMKVRDATTDDLVTRRRWVLVDIDPVRPAGTSATDAELEAAHRVSGRVFKHLRGLGFHDPVVAMSGNGWHLLYKVDMPNDAAHTDLVKRFILTLGLLFNAEGVDVDRTVFNAARICKLYGTVARKGTSTAERPWRMAYIAYVPETVEVNGDDLFMQVADRWHEPETPARVMHGDGRTGPFSLEAFLDSHGIGYRVERAGQSEKFVLDHCFFNPEHRGKDAAIFRDPSGKLTYFCFHNSCQGHTWHEMREALEPDAYRREQQPAVHPGLRREEKRYEIRDEMPALGPKWYTLKDIPAINLDDLERVFTRFPEIDKAIRGLAMGEVTVLTGTNASGKSSWLNTLMLNIVEQGAKVAVWSGELIPQVLKSWITLAAAGNNMMFIHPSKFGDGRYYVLPDVVKQIEQWLDGKLFVYNNEYGTKWEQIFADMKTLSANGVRLFVLDNLMTLDINLLGTDKLDQQRNVMIQMKDFAKKAGAHVILVAHPRKTFGFLRKDDISGSGDIANVADNVLIIHRVGKDFKRLLIDTFPEYDARERRNGAPTGEVRTAFDGYGNVVEIAKNRMFGIQDKFCGLQYDTASRRFAETAENFDKPLYGWYKGAAFDDDDDGLPFAQTQTTLPF